MFRKVSTIRSCFILCIFFLCTHIALANGPPFFMRAKRSKIPKVQLRLTVTSLIDFYTANVHHTKNLSQKMSGVLSLKGEIRLNPKYNAFFLIGAEYMVHGFSFNSYYFTQDTLQLYDGNFAYSYNLYIHELDVPLQLKYAFKRENNSKVSPYIMVGYHFRTLLFGELTVKENGQKILGKQERITFKNPLLSNVNNPFMSLTLGIQKNNPNTGRNSLFVELSYRYGFSPYLLSDTFTPSSLYFNGSHLGISLGIKF